MTISIVGGQTDWRRVDDDDGHRTYKLKFIVKCETTDGPANATLAPGLPLVGSYWLVDSDVDLWAWCRPNKTITPLKTNEPNNYFEIEYVFSTKPGKRCIDFPIEDPLLEPMRVSGGGSNHLEEATHDRFGTQILNSAHETIHGRQVEFDSHRHVVRIQQNVPSLGLALFSSMENTVNDQPMWGLPARTIKLRPVHWEEKRHGQCEVYYTRTFEFEIDFRSFDRMVSDVGTKALSGYWNQATGAWTLKNVATGTPPDRRNPSHFIRFKDFNGENTKIMLDGYGVPFNPIFTTPVTTCDECGVTNLLPGAPRVWRVSNMDLDASQPPDISLNYVADCRWEGGVGTGPVYTLEFDTTLGGYYADQPWILTTPTGGVYERDRRQWKADGPNTMFLTVNAGSNPRTVTLVAGNRPGSIAVSKYAESNFYLLGIPLYIG